MARRRLHALLLAGLVLTALGPGRAASQARWEPGTAGQPIPAAPFKTWSLFLVCNLDWLLAEKQPELVQLYQRFRAFGEAIGPQHLAAWFWKRPPRWGSAGLAEDIDVERSVTYCARFGVRPSEGPHVVVTTVYPDRWESGDQKIVLALNGLPAGEITRLLATLSDQLVTQALRQEELDSERYWLSWRRSFEALGSGLASYVKRVTLSIDAKFFKLEIVGGGG